MVKGYGTPHEREQLTMRMPCLSSSILDPESPNFCSSSTATGGGECMQSSARRSDGPAATCFELRVSDAGRPDFVDVIVFVVCFPIAAETNEGRDNNRAKLHTYTRCKR
jgi:hypothetical protein